MQLRKSQESLARNVGWLVGWLVAVLKLKMKKKNKERKRKSTSEFTVERKFVVKQIQNPSELSTVAHLIRELLSSNMSREVKYCGFERIDDCAEAVETHSR
ncbi:uncharacterized protein LOC141892553 isoform X2 [Acropora palmata]